MSRPAARRPPEPGREHVCREVEDSVSRLAKLVLHASALADRMDALAATDLSSTLQRRERIRVLREAASAGQSAICRVGLAALSPPAEQDADQAPPGEPAWARVPERRGRAAVG